VAMLPTACLSNLLGSLVSLAFARPLAVGQLDLAYLALFGFVQMTLGLTLFTIGSRLIPAAETALISALEMPLAPLWVWLAFGETVSAQTLVGGALSWRRWLAMCCCRTRAVLPRVAPDGTRTGVRTELGQPPSPRPSEERRPA